MVINVQLPYISKILVSKKRNPKYYSTVKRRGHKIVLKGSRIDQRIIEGVYTLDSNGVVLNEDKEKIIANSRSVGKPKYWVVNFQDVWNGNIRFQFRNTIMLLLKKAFLEELEKTNLFKQDFTNFYPIRIELFIFAQEMPVDVDNKGAIYFKCFQDILKDYCIIDDSSEYINDTGRTKWIKVNSEVEEKMTFRISKSNNEYD